MLTGGRRDQGSGMAFPQLAGCFLNARLGAILEQNQPDLLPVEGGQNLNGGTVKSELRHREVSMSVTA